MRGLHSAVPRVQHRVRRPRGVHRRALFARAVSRARHRPRRDPGGRTPGGAARGARGSPRSRPGKRNRTAVLLGDGLRAEVTLLPDDALPRRQEVSVARSILSVLVLLVAAGCATPPPPAPSGEFPNESLTVGSVKREYRLYVPPSANIGRPAPLLVAFHGMLVDSKDVMPRYTKLNETAERHGFIIAYPQALGGVWGLLPDRVDADVAMFDVLVARVSAAYRVDPTRIDVLGMSNGGYFAHLVAKERSSVVAAVASHSGPLGLQTLGGVNAARKFPVLIVHGGQDWIFAPWIARENAEKYRREGHEVEYIELPALGHAWAADADINERIWRFFAAHPRAVALWSILRKDNHAR